MLWSHPARAVTGLSGHTKRPNRSLSHARPGADTRDRRRVAARVGIEGEAAVARQVQHGALGERRDGEQRIDAERARHDRRRRSRRARRARRPSRRRRAPSNTWHLWLTTPVAALAAHAAAAQRMRGGRLLAHHGAGQRVLDVAAAGLPHQRLQRRVEAPVDRLVLGRRARRARRGRPPAPAGPRRCRATRRRRSAGWRTAPCRRRRRGS